MNKCIYCNTTIDLNESHIVPDSLTNKKISLKDSVCTKLHNSTFSDQFESKIINNLKFLTDHLDIGNKENKFPKISALVTFDGLEKPIFTKMNKYSPIVSEKTIQGLKNKGVTEKSISKISYDLNISETFSNLEAKRLAAKIAYEWYCKLNSIHEKYDCFDKIVKFICDSNFASQNETIVQYVTNPDFYKLYDEHCLVGSHLLICYKDEASATRILISLFGICFYEVELSTDFLEYPINYAIEELQSIGENIIFKSKKLESFVQYHGQFLQEEFGVPLGIEIPEKCDYTKKNIVSLYLVFFPTKNNLKLNKSSFKEFEEYLITRYHELINSGVMSIRALKRFCKEKYPKDSNELLNMNLEKSDIFSLYVLYMIGKKPSEVSNNKDINDLLKNALPNSQNTLFITDETISACKETLIQDENYLNYLQAGYDNIINL